MSDFPGRRHARGHSSSRRGKGRLGHFGDRSQLEVRALGGHPQQSLDWERPQTQVEAFDQQGRGASLTRGRVSSQRSISFSSPSTADSCHESQRNTDSDAQTSKKQPAQSSPLDLDSDGRLSHEQFARQRIECLVAERIASVPADQSASIPPLELRNRVCIALATDLARCQQQLAQATRTQSPTTVTRAARPTDEPRPAAMGTPVLDQFLQEIKNIFHQKNGARLQDTLQLEPPLPPAYSTIVSELNANFRRGNDKGLVTRCEQIIPVAEDGIGSAWSAFPDFLTKYFRFLRDTDPGNLADLYEKLKSLTNQSIICLSDNANGLTILPTVLYLSKVLAKVAIGLDRNPDLVVNTLKDHGSGNMEEAAEKVTFVESSANVLREAFIKCLADKSGTGGVGSAGRKARPENKRTGIYMTANSCLKLLFQCRKLRNAQQMFASIEAQSPLLSHYPASQRVTYLFYLGRYLFANSHFHRAQLCLDSAYRQCHAQALRQRQTILTYLITSNLCLGRFPSSKLLMRREAADLTPRFSPLCKAIARGDLSEFRRLLSVESDEGQWFLRKRLLLQLRSTCEVLVWRSLVRKVFILSGYMPQGDDNKMPFLRLPNLQTAMRWLEQREAHSTSRGGSNGLSITFTLATAPKSTSDSTYVDKEFEGVEEAIAENGFDVDTGMYHDQHTNTQETSNGLVLGEANLSSVNGVTADEQSPTLAEVESIVASMLQQGLLNGFLTHSTPRFAIPGSKAGGGALKVGFPNIWQMIAARSTNHVPGWVQESNTPDDGGGRIVHLTGARPAGA